RIDCRPEFLNSDTSSCLGRIEIRPTTRSRAADTRSRHKVEICSVQAASDWNATGHASAPSLAVDGTVRFPSYRQPSTVNRQPSTVNRQRAQSGVAARPSPSHLYDLERDRIGAAVDGVHLDAHEFERVAGFLVVEDRAPRLIAWGLR